MADSDAQLWPLTCSIHAIAARFAERPDVYASGDIFVHYLARNETGVPMRGQIAPDVLVVFDVEDRVRDSYVVWREGKVPDFVMEISSNRSWRRARIKKRTIYEALGVREYVLYDPRENYRPPRLMGLRLDAGTYREIPFESMPNGEQGLPSTTLNLYAHVDDGGRLRWFDPERGEYLRTYQEQDRERREAERRHRAAEAELASLRQELRHRRDDP
jgi:Uma2 family endonuclease